jgi:hypothetical protein
LSACTYILSQIELKKSSRLVSRLGSEKFSCLNELEPSLLL